MRTTSRLKLGAATFAATALSTTLAHAATCSVSNPSVVVAMGNYDGFSGTSLSVPFTLTLTRPSSDPTGAVDLVFYDPSSTPAYDIQKAGGQSIVTHSSSSPSLSTSSPPTASLSIASSAWSGHTASVSLTAIVPAGADLSSGSNSFNFDIRYVCAGTPGNSSAGPLTLTNGMTGNFTVLSALQASYVGSAFDFGNNPASGTSRSGNIRVASTGPFSVSVAAGSGSAYAMTYPGGNVGTAAQRIRYQLDFLGQQPDYNTSFSTVNCVSAGLDGENLPIAATLVEAGTTGAGKTAAPDYSDYISVTVTPLATASNQKSCPTLTSGGEGH